MSQGVKVIGDIIKKELRNNANWQICILKSAWKALFFSAKHAVVNLYIKEQRLFIKISSSSLKHYIGVNHNCVLEQLNSFAKKISPEWVNLQAIVLLPY
ncbi:MAG: hypothetical protein AAF770_02700 [Bacteroidota bacterium]